MFHKQYRPTNRDAGAIRYRTKCLCRHLNGLNGDPTRPRRRFLFITTTLIIGPCVRPRRRHAVYFEIIVREASLGHSHLRRRHLVRQRTCTPV